MVTCPVCLNSVDQLKTNSHVIPRFLIVQTKVSGQNVAFSQDKVKEKNQTDIKADMVCDACELKFKKDDDFAKDFFDHQKFVANRIVYPMKTAAGKQCGYEEYKPECFKQLKLFVISIFLRHHLYLQIKESRNLLGPHFENLRDAYVNDNISHDIYPTCMLRYFNFSALGYPTRERSGGINSVFMMIQSYRIWMYMDSRHHFEESFEPFIMNSQNVRALLVDESDSKLMKDIFEVIEKNKKS